MPLDAGDLTDRITIEEPTESRNDVGEAILAWSTFATVWAEVQTMSGREAERHGMTAGINAYRVTIRHLTGLQSSMRIIHDGRTLEIGQVNEKERKWHQELLCTEKVAE